MNTSQVLNAFQKAKDARLLAHAPYSQFLVGACFKVLGEDKFVSGCNIENASFGATVCAERVALWKWVSEKAKGDKLEFLVLVTDTENPVATPCGMCLQVMSEFVDSDFPLYIGNLKGVQQSLTLSDLLPSTFKLKV